RCPSVPWTLPGRRGFHRIPARRGRAPLSGRNQVRIGFPFTVWAEVAVAAEWWAHALGWSAAGRLAAGLALAAGAPRAPYGCLHDFPEAGQEAAAEPTPAQRRAGAVGGAGFLAVLVAVRRAVPLGGGLTHPGAPWWSLTAMAVVA